ncbi:MAG: hypothetical protein R3240_08845, partial [Gammaproteobacteria bacterium]|nr:hypothetical protein [Gammaproteobacteria bacterium]
EAQAQQNLAQAKQEYQQALQSKQSELAKQKQASLAKAQQEYNDALNAQKSAMESQKREALAQAQQAFQKAIDSKHSAMAAKAQADLQQAQMEHAKALADQKSALEGQKKQALADAKQAYENALASNQSKLAAEKKAALAKAQGEYDKALQEKVAGLEAEKQAALGQAQKSFANALNASKKAAAADKAGALAKAQADFDQQLGAEKVKAERINTQLTRFQKVAEAKEKIVTQLRDNFKEFGNDSVEIDSKTGKVKLHFQQSYFKRGRGELTEEMKALLRVMIPKYARSIYGNKDAAKQVGALKITGLTSPVYKGRYIDVNDTSKEAEEARAFNIKLSNERAMAMFNFIFNDPSMSEFPHREELKKDMGVSAQGFLNATPVPKALVGKKALCVEYDCSQEQAAVLQFQMNLDGQ